MPALRKEEKVRARRNIVRRSLVAVGAIAKRLLPKGRVKGAYWEAPDPRRGDDSSRSFSVHLVTGQWQNFRNNKRGQDLISLLSYLADMSDDKAQAAVNILLEHVRS